MSNPGFATSGRKNSQGKLKGFRECQGRTRVSNIRNLYILVRERQMEKGHKALADRSTVRRGRSSTMTCGIRLHSCLDGFSATTVPYGTSDTAYPVGGKGGSNEKKP